MNFTIAAILPINADGTRLTCASLLKPETTCRFIDNQAINTVFSIYTGFGRGGADPNEIYGWTIDVEAGQDRIVFVQATSDQHGGGDVLASGCVDGIVVLPDQAVQIAMQLTRWD